MTVRLRSVEPKDEPKDMQCSEGAEGRAEGHAIQPGTDNGTRRGLTGNTCHRLLDEKPGLNARAKLEPTIQ
jgi:hypothetical protein